MPKVDELQCKRTSEESEERKQDHRIKKLKEQKQNSDADESETPVTASAPTTPQVVSNSQNPKADRESKCKEYMRGYMRNLRVTNVKTTCHRNRGHAN
jgi:hypothetical protein